MSVEILRAELAEAKTKIRELNQRIEQLELNAKDNEVLVQERYSDLLVRIDRTREMIRGQ